VEGAYGRTEGSIEEIALAAGPVVKLVTESGRVISVAGFYQWLEKNGYDAGSVQHSQIGIALGTEKNKDKFRLYVGLPLSGKQLEKSTSSSSTIPTTKETDTYVETTYTKTTTINEWVQEAVANLTLEWEHWFNEKVAGKVGVFYANGVKYHVKGIEHQVDPEFKGILGVIFKLPLKLPFIGEGYVEISPEVRAGQGKPEYYFTIKYTPDSRSSNGKNTGDGQKAKNEKNQEMPELLVPVETENIKTVRYEQVREIIEKTVTTDYKATIEDLLLSVDVNVLTANWIGKDLNGDEITLYRYKLESENSSWTETQDNSVTIEDIAKGSHIFYIQAYSNGKWGPVSQERVDVNNSAPKIDSLEDEVKGNDITYSWTASDPNPEDKIKKYKYRFDKGNWIETIATHLKKKNLKKGSHTFELKAYDGTDWSEVEEITSKLDNRVPTVSNVNAFPNDPVVGIHGVAVSYVFKDADGDLESKLTKREWYKNGVLQSQFNGRKVIDKDELSAGEWYVDITPYDGENFGKKVRSDTITVHADEPEPSPDPPQPDPDPPPPPPGPITQNNKGVLEIRVV